jgi:CO/xanthine dehydrogenase FAD-binding subunit
MMKPVDFAYERPSTVEAALRFLDSELAGVSILAGGQSLIPLLANRILRPAAVLDLGRLPGLTYIREELGWVRIGARATQSECCDSAVVRTALPLLAEAIRWVATPQVRNRGTLVGSVAQRNPTSEIPVAAAALDAVISIGNVRSGRREVPVTAFLDPASTATLQPGDLVLEAAFPRQPGGTGWGFVEVQRRHAHYALACAAATFRLDGQGRIIDPRVSVGGLGTHAMRLAAVENTLVGQRPGPELFETASLQATADPRIIPLDDANAPAEYRHLVVPVVIRRALIQAVDRLASPAPCHAG